MILLLKGPVKTHVLCDVKEIRYFHQDNTLPLWVFITSTERYEFSDKDLSTYKDICTIDGGTILRWLKRTVTPVTKIEFVTND